MVALPRYNKLVEEGIKMKKFMNKNYTWQNCWVVMKDPTVYVQNGCTYGQRAPRDYVPTQLDVQTGYTQERNNITFIKEVVIIDPPIKLCGRASQTPMKLKEVNQDRANRAIQQALLTGPHYINKCPW